MGLVRGLDARSASSFPAKQTGEGFLTPVVFWVTQWKTRSNTDSALAEA